MIKQYDFHRTKYGEELLIDLIRLEHLEEYLCQTPVQRLSYYDITVISEGTGTFSIDNYEQTLVNGSVFFSSPGQIRKWNTPEVPKGFVVIFEDEFLTTFFNDSRFVKGLWFFNNSGHPPFIQLSEGDYSHVKELLVTIEKEINTFRTSDKHMLRALLYQLLVFFNRKHDSTPLRRSSNRYVDSFIQLVDVNHIRFRAVDYYADQLHVTAGHLTSVVKEFLGVTAKEYILNRNILEAKRLLQYSDLSIDEIALALNYESTTYFIRVFKQHAGITPLNFRKFTNP
ncbi:MAG TPA: helix-turn-helix transcriptional regulator [Cyclobacteriaceae bacterium]|nr:helix-turn-helix transcriptional regulator [Cyclobacteriaceae bacterium]